MNHDENERSLRELGITEAMCRNCPLPRQSEQHELIDCGEDMYGRNQSMTQRTLNKWTAMKAAALAEGIDLKLVSAYRSVQYQCDLIKQKLEAGRTLEDILQANTIPGYSEHHTGRAIDLHAGDAEPLTEAFEREPAFAWLVASAHQFDFTMSYPRGNPAGIAYEPWHWCCKITS
jgi:D-alanyl-D-alanine carboxypeptidase